MPRLGGFDVRWGHEWRTSSLASPRRDQSGSQPVKLGELLVLVDAAAQHVVNLRIQQGTRRRSLHLA
jgi:hypothetical protein